MEGRRLGRAGPVGRDSLSDGGHGESHLDEGAQGAVLHQQQVSRLLVLREIGERHSVNLVPAGTQLEHESRLRTVVAADEGVVLAIADAHLHPLRTERHRGEEDA